MSASVVKTLNYKPEDYPVKSKAVRKEFVREGTCPDSGGNLSVGLECVDCLFDGTEKNP